MKNFEEKLEAAYAATRALSVQIDVAREVMAEVEESRHAESMDDVFDARDHADDVLTWHSAHGPDLLAAITTVLDAIVEPIPQSSASERVERARAILAEWDEATIEEGASVREFEDYEDDKLRLGELAIGALRDLVTPPSMGESEHDAAMRIASAYFPEARGTAYEAAARGIHTGIQWAHERWEPTDRPSQEQMLRWLGLRFGAAGRPTHIHIPFQTIEREEI